MCKILISIKKEHVNNILNETKKYEFRTRIAKREINTLVIYCSSPVQRVVAEIEVLSIVHGTPDQVWEITKEKSGIKLSYFNEYFKNRKIAYAYKLGKVTKYKQPKRIEEFGKRFPPQSYCYL